MKLKFKIFLRVNIQVVESWGLHQLFVLKGSLEIEKMDSNGSDFGWILIPHSCLHLLFLRFFIIMGFFISLGFRFICYNSNKNDYDQLKKKIV